MHATRSVPRRWWLPILMLISSFLLFLCAAWLAVGPSSSASYLPALSSWCAPIQFILAAIHPNHGALRNNDANNGEDDDTSGVHLLTQWYWDPILSRHRELLQASRENVQNVYIQRVHWLLGAEVLTGGVHGTGDGDTRDHDTEEDADDMQRVERFKREFIRAALEEMPDYPVEEWRRKTRVHVLNHTSRLLASDAFRYATDKWGRRRQQSQQELAEERVVAVLANLDIAFDDSVRLLMRVDIDLSWYTAYFLSRYEFPENEETSEIGTQCGPKFIGSHDAIGFVPPLPRALIGRCAYALGTWGIESRLLWEFEQAGIRGRNPCFDIRVWHHHGSGVKHAEMPVVNVDNKSSIAFPEYLVVPEKEGENTVREGAGKLGAQSMIAHEEL